MAQEITKSESKRVQRQHVRRYAGNRIRLVNPGVFHKHHPKHAPQMPVQPAKQESPPPQPAVPLKQRQDTTEQLKPKATPSKAESADTRKWAEDTVYSLTFPTIAWQGMEGSYPEEIRKSLQQVRMIQLMKSREEFREKATDEEAMGYISTATLAAPPDRDWVDIYTFLFNKWAKGRKMELPAELKSDAPLTPDQQKMLDDLKRWIRKTQYAEMKRREKARKEEQS